jgi:hypothetical protein
MNIPPIHETESAFQKPRKHANLFLSRLAVAGANDATPISGMNCELVVLPVLLIIQVSKPVQRDHELDPEFREFGPLHLDRNQCANDWPDGSTHSPPVVVWNRLTQRVR